MAAGDVKQLYAAAVTLTQTNLDGLASDAQWDAGWGSDTIDNSSNQYLDFIVNAVVQVESAGLTNAEIRMYLVAELNDTAYPDCLSAGTEGTEGAITFHDVQVRDAVCRRAATVATNTTGSRLYHLMCPSVAAVFDGVVPRKFFIFIAQSTGVALETTGDPNQVYVKGVYGNVAQS